MSEEYIEVKIPILTDVKEMEIVKTFSEEQLWYVCAIATAFEKKEAESKKLQQKIDKAIDLIDRLYEPETHAYLTEEELETLEKILKGDNND